MDEDMEFAGDLIRLALAVQYVLQDESRKYDLTPQQSVLMSSLLDRPVGMAELSDRLHIEKSTLTGLVDRAERRGLVVRTPDPADRRALLVRLTDSGRALIDEAVGAGLAQQQQPRLRAAGVELEPDERAAQGVERPPVPSVVLAEGPQALQSHDRRRRQAVDVAPAQDAGVLVADLGERPPQAVLVSRALRAIEHLAVGRRRGRAGPLVVAGHGHLGRAPQAAPDGVRGDRPQPPARGVVAREPRSLLLRRAQLLERLRVRRLQRVLQHGVLAAGEAPAQPPHVRGVLHGELPDQPQRRGEGGDGSGRRHGRSPG
jgi:DNA-binding MarR family transcriptional regulator